MSILPTLDGGTLGQDIMFEILLSSSIESLRKLSLVSRNWEGFLGNPYFARLYYKRNPRKELLALPVSENKLVLLEKSHPPNFSVQNLPLECKEMKMVGSCEGLLAFVHSTRGFLWDPLSQLGKTFDLPPSTSGQLISTGLGYDSERSDYKIVLLVSSAAETQVKSYSSKSNLWIDLTVVPFLPKPNSNSKFVLNGIPYWVGEDTNRKKSVVFNFNPTSDSYNLIAYPAVDKSRKVFVVRLGEYIGALAYSPSDHTVDVFLHRKEEGWVKSFASIGPVIQNNLGFDVAFMQYFKETIIGWDSNTSFFYNREPLILLSQMISPLQPRVNQSYCHFKSVVHLSGAACYYPSSTGEVFRDYNRRRSSLIRALTTDSEMLCRLWEFYEDCSPDSAAIRLYGLPDDWELKDTSADFHARRGPGELPDPFRGIKFPKSSTEVTEWLCTVAGSCDSWLLAVALHMGAAFGFDRPERLRLFLLINDLPTVYEVVRAKMRTRKALKR